MVAEPIVQQARAPVEPEPVRVEPALVRVEPVRVEPVRVEPVRVEPEPVQAAPAWVEPVRIVALEPEPEPETESIAEPLDSMSTFGAGILQARRGPNKLFLFAVLLAVVAIGALVVMR